MRTNEQYTPRIAPAVLVVGDPGSGKTRLVMAIPNPAILDCDGNLHSALRLNPTKKFLIAEGQATDDGKEVPEVERWLHCEREMKLLLKGVIEGKAETIIVEGLSNLARWGLTYAEQKLKDAGIDTKKEYLAKYQSFIPMFTQFITMCRIPKKPLFITVHQCTDKSEFGAMRFYLDIPGRLSETLGGQVTDMWGMKATPDPTNVKTMAKYEICTKPSGYHPNLKTAFDFAPVINITDLDHMKIWSLLEPKLSINVNTAPKSNVTATPPPVQAALVK